MPGDFDVGLITWKPDYDAFYYRQLHRRSRFLYLFHSEYIFDLEAAVVVETPQLGHATYLAARRKASGHHQANRLAHLPKNALNAAEQWQGCENHPGADAARKQPLDAGCVRPGPHADQACSTSKGGGNDSAGSTNGGRNRSCSFVFPRSRSNRCK